jgi:hypothetical protein
MTITELILQAGNRENSAISKLPQHVVPRSRVRYAVANATPSDGAKKCHFQCLDVNGSPGPTNEDSADLLIISLDIQDSGSLESLVGLASQQLAKREATILVTSRNEFPALTLAGRSLQLASRLERNNSLALYSHMSTGSGPISNGSSKNEVVILEPSITTSVAREFISMLHESLQHKGSLSLRSIGLRESLPKISKAGSPYLYWSWNSHSWTNSLSSTSTVLRW